MSRSSPSNAGNPFWLVSIHRRPVGDGHQHWGFIVQDKDDALDKENPPRRGGYGVFYLPQTFMNAQELPGGRQRAALQVRTTASSTHATARISEVLGTSERPRWIPSGLITFKKFLLHVTATSELLKNPPRSRSTPPAVTATVPGMRSLVPSRSTTPSASGTASQAAQPLMVEIFSIHKGASSARSGSIYWGVFNRSFPVGATGTVIKSCVVRINNQLMDTYALTQGVQNPHPPLVLWQPYAAMSDVALHKVLRGQQLPPGMTYNGTTLPQYALHLADSEQSLQIFRRQHPRGSPRASPKLATAAITRRTAASAPSSPALGQIALARPNSYPRRSFFDMLKAEFKNLPPTFREMSSEHIVAKVLAIEGTHIKYQWKNGATCSARILSGQLILSWSFCIVDRRLQHQTHIVCSLGPDPFVRGSIWRAEPKSDGTCEVWFNIVYPTLHQGFLPSNRATLDRQQVEAWKDPATGNSRPPQRDDKIECDSIRLYGSSKEVVWDVRGGQSMFAPGSRLPGGLAIPSKREASGSPGRSPGQPVKRVQTDWPSASRGKAVGKRERSRSPSGSPLRKRQA